MPDERKAVGLVTVIQKCFLGSGPSRRLRSLVISITFKIRIFKRVQYKLRLAATSPLELNSNVAITTAAGSIHWITFSLWLQVKHYTMPTKLAALVNDGYKNRDKVVGCHVENITNISYQFTKVVLITIITIKEKRI